MHVSVWLRRLERLKLLSVYHGLAVKSISKVAARTLWFLKAPRSLNLQFHFHRSSSTMEQAAAATATPAEVNNPALTEKNTVKGATETVKRKSDETDEPESSGRGKRRRGAGGKKLRPGERYIPPPQKRNPGISFSQEHFNETSYYFESGLRKVYPYYFDFKTYCKGRWIGKSLHEVFKSEFRAESIEYYLQACKEGRIRLNETPVEDLSVVLRVSTCLCD